MTRPDIFSNSAIRNGSASSCMNVLIDQSHSMNGSTMPNAHIRIRGQLPQRDEAGKCSTYFIDKKVVISTL